MMKNLLLLSAVAVATAGCGSMTYRPVQEMEFDRLASEGCKRAGDRFATTARVNSASRETIVLWDGFDGTRTVAVRLPKQGLGSRMQDKIGQSRYDLAFDQLNALRESGGPVTFTMRCEAAGMAPAADRFSYFQDGRRVQYEF